MLTFNTVCRVEWGKLSHFLHSASLRQGKYNVISDKRYLHLSHLGVSGWQCPVTGFGGAGRSKLNSWTGRCGILYILNVCLHSDIHVDLSVQYHFPFHFSTSCMGQGCCFDVPIHAFEATKPMKLGRKILDMFSTLRLHVIRHCVPLLQYHSLSFA
jgi:hypothetical protein